MAVTEGLKEMGESGSESSGGDLMRVEYRELTDAERDQIKVIKGMGSRFCGYLSGLPASREMSLARTKIEEAVMWAVKGVTERVDF